MNFCTDDKPHRFNNDGDCTGEDCYATESQRYTIYVERDQWPDVQRYPEGIAWRSGILDEDGQEIDGEGDLPDYATARELALSTLSRLL
jgi:hypothetical protein